MEILRRAVWSMMRAMCGLQLKDMKRSIDLMSMLDLREIIDQFAMANKQCSVVWSCIEKRWWLCLEKGIRFPGWRPKEERECEEDTKKQVEEGSVKVWMMSFPDQSWLLALIWLLLSWGESYRPYLLGILPDLIIGVSLWCQSVENAIFRCSELFTFI